MRLLEFARAAGDGAGERPALIAEQLAFQEAVRQRRTVHRHERPMCARTASMDIPSQDLLAGAALALDQNRGLTDRDAFDGVQDPQHRGIVCDELHCPSA